MKFSARTMLKTIREMLNLLISGGINCVFIGIGTILFSSGLFLILLLGSIFLDLKVAKWIQENRIPTLRRYGWYIFWMLYPWELLGKYFNRPFFVPHLNSVIRSRKNEKGRILIKLQEHLFRDHPNAYSPLHTAAEVGNCLIVIPLLQSYPRSEFHVRLNARDENGWTPFEIALIYGQKQFLILLIQIGAKATGIGIGSNLKCRRLLAALGLDPNFKELDSNRRIQIRNRVYFQSSLLSRLLPWT